uniref:Uncharacterized protein n=1 Tax=Oryza sativa subsp. japonica TaxID=39947 RepID=Q2QTH1_ORYSJ|nr:hypothetical protein LOC_Os12g19660 [Oryza sativa Japonica Group]
MPFQPRRAAAVAVAAASHCRRRVRAEEEYPGNPFAAVASRQSAVATVEPSRAVLGPRRRPLFVVVRRCSLHRRAFSLRKVQKRLKKLKASHMDPKQPFEHVEPV